MRNSPDPSEHRRRETQVIDHLERLATDERLRVDTTRGRSLVVTLDPKISKDDRAVELKRLMAELGVPDRELEARMPTGRQVEITLSRRFLFLFNKTVGRIKAVCISPWRELLDARKPEPMGLPQLTEALAKFGQAQDGVPLTLVVASTAGFTREAHELAQRTANRTVVLLEPHDAGGWTVTGPAEAKAMVDLFDPELDSDKRTRVREELQRRAAELLSSGVSAERVAFTLQLPVQLVEDELKSYASQSPGCVARRLAGNVVLFREGNRPASGPAASGDSSMPFLQKLRALFGGKPDNTKKIGLLSERRAALSVQRDQAYEEMSVLETKESDLREQFKATTSALTKKRITTQLVQIRKDLERRQQLLGMLNQQVNVVSTHLHNIELVQQGQSAKLPETAELETDAEEAEKVIAELQASSEMADSMVTSGPAGMSDEEQALFEELERESAAAEAQKQPAAKAPAQQQAAKATPEPNFADEEIAPPPLPKQKQRGPAEPG